MITFWDEKKQKQFEMKSSDLVAAFRTMASGATLPLQPSKVNWQEVTSLIGMRGAPRNKELGVVVTKPDDKSFFVETVWDDTEDKQADGDMTLFSEDSTDHFTYVRLKPEEIRKLFPQWDGYHHGDKSYF